MPLYDWIAPFYDPVLRPFYRPFRKRALEHLSVPKSATVLDLACGTGQNFPALAKLVGERGKIIGVDLSAGMLRRARNAVPTPHPPPIILLKMDAALLSSEILRAQAKTSTVDAVICTFGLTAMRDWQTVFHRTFALLKPGGLFLIHDIHAVKRTLHVRFVEKITRVDQSRHTWDLLERKSHDFHLEYLDPSAYLFGGRLFVATGIKPMPA